MRKLQSRLGEHEQLVRFMRAGTSSLRSTCTGIQQTFTEFSTSITLLSETLLADVDEVGALLTLVV